MWFQMKSAYKLLPCLCHSKDSRQLLPGCIVFSQGCCYLSKTRSHGSKECETWCYNGQEPNRNLHDDALLISVFIKFGILVSSVVQIAYEHFSMGLDIYIDHSFGWQWLSTKATLFMFCRYDAVTCCPFYTLQTQFVGAHVSKVFEVIGIAEQLLSTAISYFQKLPHSLVISADMLFQPTAAKHSKSISTRYTHSWLQDLELSPMKTIVHQMYREHKSNSEQKIMLGLLFASLSFLHHPIFPMGDVLASTCYWSPVVSLLSTLNFVSGKCSLQ